MAKHEQPDERLDALLRHVVHTAPMPRPPANFAREMAQQVRDFPEEAGLESWLVRALLVLAAVAAAGFAIPFASFATARLGHLLEGAPWPLLLAAAFVFGAMKVVEVARWPLRVHGET